MSLKALKELRKHGMMHPEKVTVMSDTEEGLEEGLDKAKELLESGLTEEFEEEDDDDKWDDLSDEDIDKMSIEELRECLKEKIRD